ncbi:helix-turn-helix domain-containing protein [Brevibacillus massiliensis]|jgi:transcriptional regulator with XRE-family HTH domain|uniref:helix-turn-helix domain-containing protein n=1 Tax=Brevibacillus massiliensis TaxID=1118054 RepID=UPI0002FD6F87|nr:XRE family transcriptional regulator [Brevibacillus massiliensis]
MNHPIHTIGQKIRMFRKEKGFTLEVLADKTGLSKGLLSQVERGISQPSLDSLWKITRALEASFAQFFEELDQKRVYHIYKEKRREMLFPESTGSYSLLSKGGNAKLGLIEVRLQPGDVARDRFVQQEGEECLVVTKGTVEVKAGEDTFYLKTGDSLHIDSIQQRVISNQGNEEAIILWAVTPPQL